MQWVLSADSRVKPLPFRLYFGIIILLAGSGLVASIYLALSQFRVYTDIDYRSFCAISRAINCDTVSQSPYAIFLNAPVPVWGIVGYTFLLTFIVVFVGPKGSEGRGLAVAFAISVVFSAYSVVLAFISSYYISAYCIVCIYTYAVNFMLAYMTWLVRKRFENKRYIRALISDIKFLKQQPKRFASIIGVLVCSIVSIVAFFPAYWNLEFPVRPLNLPAGLTEDGHPYIGADSPKVVITEYTDYLCFQCKKMHAYLRQLINRHPDKIRLVHRHFPMDHKFNPLVKTPFHRGSGIMALTAIYSGKIGKFWQANDYLYGIVGETGEINLNKMAEKLGLNVKDLIGALSDRTIRQQLNSDIIQGLKLGVTGTPSYIINGNVYHATIPPEILRKALE